MTIKREMASSASKCTTRSASKKPKNDEMILSSASTNGVVFDYVVEEYKRTQRSVKDDENTNVKEKQMTTLEPFPHISPRAAPFVDTKKNNEVVEEKNTVPLKSNKKAGAMIKEKNEAAAKKKELALCKTVGVNTQNEEKEDVPWRFVGQPMEPREAKLKWPHRYRGKKQGCLRKDHSEEVIQARCHYKQAEVDGILYDLYDNAHVEAGEGEDCFICKIVEMFEAGEGMLYFTAQWYYRAKDTVMKDHASLVDDKRIFLSDVRDDNPLDCLVKKIEIFMVNLNNKTSIPACDYFCDMMYLLPYSTFVKLPPSADDEMASTEESSTLSSKVNMDGPKSVVSHDSEEDCQAKLQKNSEVTLLDLYSGCGAMSTGLCLGAKLSDLNLVTRWAVDSNKYACESLKYNHPEAEVRNETAGNFLSLLKEWKNLCIYFGLVNGENPNPFEFEDYETYEDENSSNNDDKSDSKISEVKNITSVCYGDLKETGERGLWFKVLRNGYGYSAVSWETPEGLRDCRKAVKAFVTHGFRKKILPLPGDVDVICGGPPCQGISGFNRFRNKENPLEDEKNKQLAVFMEIVQYLRPRFVLMENVVDLLRFAGGFLGRYALGRLVGMDYQTRMGMLVAGAYGLPQFRMRVFMWGAHPAEKLPQFPLPTHDVVVRGNIPVEFETNVVAYYEGHDNKLEKKLLLKDAISDLPAVDNYEHRDEMLYDKDPETEFQKKIRSSRDEMSGASSGSQRYNSMLYDHRPLKLNADDYERVCQIPMRKGANFRDLRGIIIKPDNRVAFDPNIDRVLLKSGKPLVPDYAISFMGGSSSKPFGRLWWDETVPTVVTRAEPHNQVILHPEQDRVLSIRENARLQGFPDYYKLFGPVKERYIQVGNAVAVPVARVLGYSLAQAIQGITSEAPVHQLPPDYLNILGRLPPSSSEDETVI